MTLPPTKTLLIGGAAVVVALVVISKLRSSGSAPAAATTTSPSAGAGAATGVGAGQLASWESSLTSQLDAWEAQQTAAAATTSANPPAGTTTASNPPPTVIPIGAGATSTDTSSSSSASTPAPAATPVASAASAQDTLGMVPGPAGSELDVLGKITAAGGVYHGVNVAGGAPVYALVGGRWQQGFDPSALPAGTPLATPITDAASIVGLPATETL